MVRLAKEVTIDRPSRWKMPSVVERPNDGSRHDRGGTITRASLPLAHRGIAWQCQGQLAITVTRQLAD